MFEKRQLTMIHYVVLVLIILIAIGLNGRLLYINATECTSDIPCVCTEILSYKISRYIAYASLVLMGLYSIYLYLIHEGKSMVVQQSQVKTRKPFLRKPILKQNKKTNDLSLKKTLEEDYHTKENDKSHIQSKTKDEVKEIIIIKEVRLEQDKKIIEQKPKKQVIKATELDPLPAMNYKEPKKDKPKTKTKAKTNSIYKKDIAEYIFNHTGLSMNKALKFLNILIEEISYNLLEGGGITVDGLGTFNKYRVGEYTGTNPQTKKEYLIESNNRIRYIPDANLEKSLNEKNK